MNANSTKRKTEMPIILACAGVFVFGMFIYWCIEWIKTPRRFRNWDIPFVTLPIAVLLLWSAWTIYNLQADNTDLENLTKRLMTEREELIVRVDTLYATPVYFYVRENRYIDTLWTRKGRGK
jgi:hypothetical protein